MRISDWSSDVCSSDLWDAYGEGPPDAQGRIYRAGANDDALGVAGLFEIARLFKAAPPPDRTIAFAFWTSEERGLRGSEAYAATPIFPLAKNLANLGLDIPHGTASWRERVCQNV